MNTYARIEEVMKKAGKPLTEFEFGNVSIENGGDLMSGQQYIGASQSTLGRRLRELRQMGRVTSKRRKGKAFIEYALAVREPVAA